jgi:hypothetical protein
LARTSEESRSDLSIATMGKIMTIRCIFGNFDVQMY